MLVLRRKAGEAIVLNGVITIHVLAVEGERVKLGISAPPEVVIVRSELLEGQGHLGGPAAPMGAGGPGPVPRDPIRPYRTPEPGPYRTPAPGPYRTPAPGPYRTPEPGPAPATPDDPARRAGGFDPRSNFNRYRAPSQPDGALPAPSSSGPLRYR
jgi:carbon storage regulator